MTGEDLGPGAEATDIGVQGRTPRALPWALAAGLAAGVVAWLGGEAIVDAYGPPTHLIGSLEKSAQLVREQSSALIKNAALASGLFGAILGTFLGAAGGLARGSAARAGAAGALGLALGTVAGAATAMALIPIYDRNQLLASDGLAFPALIHGGIWGPLGAVGGLAFGLGLGGRGAVARGLVGGLAGALLGTVAFEILGTLLDPMAEASRPVAATPAIRLLSRVAVAIPAALAAAWAVASEKGPGARNR